MVSACPRLRLVVSLQQHQLPAALAQSSILPHLARKHQSQRHRAQMFCLDASPPGCSRQVRARVTVISAATARRPTSLALFNNVSWPGAQMLTSSLLCRTWLVSALTSSRRILGKSLSLRHVWLILTASQYLHWCPKHNHPNPNTICTSRSIDPSSHGWSGRDPTANYSSC